MLGVRRVNVGCSMIPPVVLHHSYILGKEQVIHAEITST